MAEIGLMRPLAALTLLAAAFGCASASAQEAPAAPPAIPVPTTQDAPVAPPAAPAPAAQDAPAASQAAPAPAQAQTPPAYAWRVQERPNGALALLAGCEACDDVPLTLACRKGGADVTLNPLLPLDAGEENGVVEVIFEIDRDAFRRDGRLAANVLLGGLTPEVTVPKGDILLAALSSGEALTVALGSKRLPLPLKGSADALRRLHAGCSAAPAATPQASAARPQRAGRAPEKEEGAGSGFSLRGILAPLDPRN